MIGDRDYDSDPPDAALQERGIEMTVRRTVGTRRTPSLRTDASSQALQEALEDRASVSQAFDLPEASGALRAEGGES